MGWSSINLFMHTKMTKYGNRLINMNNDRLKPNNFSYMTNLTVRYLVT